MRGFSATYRFSPPMLLALLSPQMVFVRFDARLLLEDGRAPP
jgi:hypothetical protein